MGKILVFCYRKRTCAAVWTVLFVNYSLLFQVCRNRSTITSIGLGLDRDTGRVTIDSSELEARLTSDPDGVANLFNNLVLVTTLGWNLPRSLQQPMFHHPSLWLPPGRESSDHTGVDISAGNVNSSNRSFH